jgi:hypothetical protein
MEKYNKLTVLGYCGKDKFGKKKVECVCDCGNKYIGVLSAIKSGNTKSCGCLHDLGNRKTHGMRKSKLYTTWANIKQRCTNEKKPDFIYYGGKGVKICSEWENDFSSFYNWAISNGWKDGLQIDRINNEGNYCPENCQCITAKENVAKQDKVIKIFENGRYVSLMDYCKIKGMNYGKISQRIRKLKWPIEKALNG